jgi:PadR family transcriptional regulator, regulatory protein PadR
MVQGYGPARRKLRWTRLRPYVRIKHMGGLRVTVAVAAVLRIFLDDTARPRYGYELMQLTGFPSGKLYPVLARLEGAGWLMKEREPVDPSVAGRPVRRIYRLTRDGEQAARSELSLLQQQLLPGGIGRGSEGGRR